MRLARRSIMVLCAILLTTSTAACTGEDAKPPTPAEILQAVEKVAGPSDVSPATKLGPLPYDLDGMIPYTQVMQIGNAEVYPDLFPDLSVVIRPMSYGAQTLIYFSGPKASSSYKFRVHLPKDTEIKTATDGSVVIHDNQTNLSIPLFQKPWAKSVKGGHSYPTHFGNIAGTQVSQIVDLSHAKFPVVADPAGDPTDPWTQIIEGRLPVLKEARTTIKDGPATNLPFGYGRYYAGPNGLEIRLTNELVMVMLELASTAGGLEAAVEQIGKRINDTVMKVTWLDLLGPDKLTKALNAVGITSYVFGSDYIHRYVLSNICMGVTIPRDGALGALRSYTILELYGAGVWEFVPIAPDEPRYWVEKCDASKPLFFKLADDATPSSPSVYKDSDVTPVTKASPIVPPVQQETKAPPQQRPKPGATYYNVSMDEACRIEYNDQGASSHTNNPDRYDSWTCILSTGDHGPVSVSEYCGLKFPGSTDMHGESADSWRCKLN